MKKMIKIFNIRPKIAFDIQFSDQFGMLNIVQEITHNGNLADKLIANFENKSRISNIRAGIMHLKQKITFAGSTIDITGKFTINCKYLIFINKPKFCF